VPWPEADSTHARHSSKRGGDIEAVSIDRGEGSTEAMGPGFPDHQAERLVDL